MPAETTGRVQAAFGSVMRERRQAMGLSQERLADLCSLDRTFISLLERGKRQPSLSTLLALSRALDTPFPEFARLIEESLREP